MKTLLRRIRHMCSQIRWLVTSPKTPYWLQRKRMIWMLHMGKDIGKREAQAELPITRVQPRQEVTGTLHLPPGQWAHAYREELHQSGQHPTASRVLRRIGVQPVQQEAWDDSWLNSPVPIDRVITQKNLENTEEMPAVVKLLHQRRQVG